jgi:hypothetical protein
MISFGSSPKKAAGDTPIFLRRPSLSLYFPLSFFLGVALARSSTLLETLEVRRGSRRGSAQRAKAIGLSCFSGVMTMRQESRWVFASGAGDP